MLLEVYDKNTLNRVDVIRTYTFIQYTDYFNDVGTFTIKVPVTEVSLPNLMIQGNFILFEKLGDKFVMGIIKYFHKEGLETTTIEVQGYLLSHVLSYRTFTKTYRKDGRVFDIQREFVSKMFIDPEDLRRKVDMFSLSPSYDPATEQISYCQTGSDAAESISEMNEPYRYGFAVVPVISKIDEEVGRTQNLSGMVFEQYVPTDRRVGNQDGNSPVMFDTALNNLEDLMFEIDATKAKTTAVVAGEDTGDNRKVIETGDTTLTGLERNELYVDARDLQKQKPNELEFESYLLTGTGAEQVIWNSSSEQSLVGVQINKIVLNGSVSVENTLEETATVRAYVVPYVGNVSYTSQTLADITVEPGEILTVPFEVVCDASEEQGITYYDAFVVNAVATSGVQYKCGSSMTVDTVPEQAHATTDEEYQEMLTQRGNEKLKENSIAYGFEATAYTKVGTAFQYGADYVLGDYVTAVDRQLGMAVGVQITGVRKSFTETGEILDLIFGNQFL